ncbi:MAG: ATP-binding protein [Thermoplasmatota archaeon]
MFVDREDELESLQNQWESKKSSFIVIYGRRRIGKTSLIKEYIKDKPHVYYLSTELPIEDQFNDIQRQAGKELDIDLLKNEPFDRWEDFFSYISDLDRRFILAIDEFPYLIQADKAIPSLFQKGWDEYLKNSKIDLILCGSSISMMEDNVLKSDSPLYGRKTSQIKLRALPLKSIKIFLPDQNLEDIVRYYSIYGGVPAYLELLDPKQTLKQNLENTLLKTDAPLRDSVDFVLKTELRKPERYRAIPANLARGSTTLNELSQDLDLQGNRVSQYLAKLRTLRLVKREEPITISPSKKKRRGHYKITDKFFRFYFHYILPNRSDIEEGNIDIVLDEFKSTESHFISPIFEEICRGHVIKKMDYSKVGRWWYKENEIDIVALNESKNKILFGECKWTKNRVDSKLLNNLKSKSKKVRWRNQDRKEKYSLFSKSGFTDDVKQKALQSKNLQLISLEDILNYSKRHNLLYDLSVFY